MNARKVGVFEMTAGAVTAFNAAKLNRFRTLIGIVEDVAEPFRATGLNPTATIGVARPGRNFGAILQRNRSPARMRHGKPDRAFEGPGRFTHGQLDLPSMFSCTPHECIAGEISMRCIRLTLA